jgi:F-box associated protein
MAIPKNNRRAEDRELRTQILQRYNLRARTAIPGSSSSINVSTSATDTVVSLEELSLETPSYIDRFHDPHIPFYAYVKPSTSLKHAEFSFFYDLPTEIQLMILQLCDASTLFSLMRTCSQIRTLANPLFWSHDSTWYHIPLIWIVSNRKPSPLPPVCVDFLHRIENVEFNCHHISKHKWRSNLLGDWDTHETDSVLNDKAANAFWKRFLTMYPFIKRVVVSNCAYPITPSLVYDEYRALLRVAPSSVSVFLALGMEAKIDMPKDLGLLRLDNESQLILVEQHWSRHRVLPPRENVTGVVGKFLRFHWKKCDLARRRAALRHLRNEVYEKYHFDGGRQIPLVCTHCCDGQEFNQAREYIRHLRALRPTKNRIWSRKLQIEESDFTSPLPAALEKQLAAIELDHIRIEQDLKAQRGQLQEEWGEVESEKRQVYEEKFLGQLQSDPHYNCGANPAQSEIFLDFSHESRNPKGPISRRPGDMC